MIHRLATSFLLFFLLFIIFSARPAAAVIDIDDAIGSNIQCGQIGLACCSREDKDFTFNVPMESWPQPFGLISRVIGVDQLLDFVIGKVGGGARGIMDHVIGNVMNTEAKQCFSGKAQGSGDSCVCVDDRVENLTRLCQGIKSPGEIQQCVVCTGGSGRNPGRGIWTGLGCFETDISALIKNTLLGLGVGLGGVVSMLCIIYSSVMLQTSGGNPERIKKAREYLTSCIAGLLLILFSVFLLQLIGVNILRLPGFS